MSLSVCVLLYGPYLDFAHRVLQSIVDNDPPQELISDLRIGLNEIGLQTRKYLFQWVTDERLVKFPIYLYEPSHNVGKYRLMRRMFYDSRRLADHVMWFDDDSYILSHQGRAWWFETHHFAERFTQIGQIWQIRQRGNQWLAIKDQPWYGGKDVDKDHYFRFCTGGWWVAQTEFLYRWDYPFMELFHNGGDSILGELIRQQRGSLFHFNRGVVINPGGRSARRGIGISVKDEVYPWQDYPRCLINEAFDCLVYRLEI